MIELDQLDRVAADAFPGHIVRKDLVRRFRGQFPVPTYVVEFMLGRYCASTDPKEIEEGLQMVQSQLADASQDEVERIPAKLAAAIDRWQIKSCGKQMTRIEVLGQLVKLGVKQLRAQNAAKRQTSVVARREPTPAPVVENPPIDADTRHPEETELEQVDRLMEGLDLNQDEIEPELAADDEWTA